MSVQILVAVVLNVDVIHVDEMQYHTFSIATYQTACIVQECSLFQAFA